MAETLQNRGLSDTEIGVSHVEEEPEKCVFCEIINGNLPSSKIAETDNAVSFMSLEGHVLVTPRRHITEEELLRDNPQEFIETLRFATRLLPAVRKAYGSTGLNIAINLGESAGQEVPHVHVHLLKPGSIRYKRPDHMPSKAERGALAERIKRELDPQT